MVNLNVQVIGDNINGINIKVCLFITICHLYQVTF